MTGSQLRLARLNSGFKAKTIASALDISENMLFAMESGRRNITEQAKLLAQRMNLRDESTIIMLADIAHRQAVND